MDGWMDGWMGWMDGCMHRWIDRWTNGWPDIRMDLHNTSCCNTYRWMDASGVPQGSVTSGVPQGSVLGPILFLIYINDLPEEVYSQVRLFADDTALYLTLESEDDSSTLQNDLNILSAWETRWDMGFNPSKCQVIHVTGSKKPVKRDYILHGQVLESVTSARYLGVDISGSLSWNPHVDRITGNANRTLGFVRRNIKTKMSKVRKTAYNTLVRPQLSFVGPHTKVRTSQIEQVQRRQSATMIGRQVQLGLFKI